jgi:CheY-like chemotaxis protein
MGYKLFVTFDPLTENRFRMGKIKILLIEDDADDIELLKDAFEQNGVNCSIDVVMEGDKAIPWLENHRQLPDVIVMDFNLPKLHGREILSQIRASENFGSIPLMVLTTSASQDDMQYAFSMGADKFITKPNTMQGFNTTVEAIVALVTPS